MRNARGVRVVRPFLFDEEMGLYKPFWLHISRDQYNNIDLDLHINPTGIINWFFGWYK